MGRKARHCDSEFEDDGDFDSDELNMEQEEDDFDDEHDGEEEEEDGREEGEEENGDEKNDNKDAETEELEKECMNLRHQDQDILKNLKDEDLLKGQAVKNQKALWDKALEFRFLLQKAFSNSNRLPQVAFAFPPFFFVAF
ncbi:hypothetical protein DVH24_006325 [Malus domestica]|uniref:AATF leucine zipper-containing domain-containing protein n=1 Tax=Malus domestica TaxID=3750 RepID=A0A498KC17_MALDO|nr:hypothetical protein DVH24_006325 [Malus domestica]